MAPPPRAGARRAPAADHNKPAPQDSLPMTTALPVPTLAAGPPD